MSLINAILEKRFHDASKILAEKLAIKKEKALIEQKKIFVAENIQLYDDEEIEFDLYEAARIKIVRARIRNGKIQRRKRVSNVKGYTMRKKGKGPARLTRMSPTERRKRRMGQRRGKLKRRQKAARIRIRMRRANMKRKALGLK
jgi:hypothetical protein